MNKIRKANIKDAPRLTDISYKAIGHWGKSDDLTITVEDIKSKIIYVLEEDTIKGFYCLSQKNKQLEKLFVDPQYTEQGISKILWEDIRCKTSEYHF